MDKVKIPNAISNQERILVVDDDVFILDTLQNGLTSSGYQCETAINAATALELISKTTFDIMIVDIVMSGMNGLELTEKVKRIRPEMKIIVITGHVDDFPYDKAIEAGASDFLTKPIERVELLLRVRNMLKVKHFENYLLRNTQMLETEVRKKTYDLQDQLDEIERANTELNLKSKLLDIANDSIFLHDLKGNFLYVNEAACRLRGYSKDELMKINLHDMDTQEYAELIKPRIKELMEKGEAIFESAHFCKDKSIMPVEVRARIIELDDKKLILSVARDITERKQAEKEIKKRVKELEEFYDMAVGRELRVKELKETMEEMKEEIESLKEELEKYRKQ